MIVTIYLATDICKDQNYIDCYPLKSVATAGWFHQHSTMQVDKQMKRYNIQSIWSWIIHISVHALGTSLQLL